MQIPTHPLRSTLNLCAGISSTMRDEDFAIIETAINTNDRSPAILEIISRAIMQSIILEGHSRTVSGVYALNKQDALNALTDRLSISPAGESCRLLGTLFIEALCDAKLLGADSATINFPGDFDISGDPQFEADTDSFRDDLDA